MARENIRLKSETKMSADEVADYLSSLAEKVRARSIRLVQGANEVSLNLPNNLVLELKVEEEEEGSKIKKSLEIELEWYEGEDNEQDVVSLM